MARHGAARQARHGKAGRGWAGQGLARQARPGEAGRGQARQGAARLGRAGIVNGKGQRAKQTI